jgi:homoserine O-acetyltransferase
MRALNLLGCCAILLGAPVRPPHAAAEASPMVDGDYVAQNFRFASGETLPELRLHYTALGKPHRNSQGHVDNAVLILHATGGIGRNFLADKFGGVLFGKGQLLDTGRYFVILPDGIGHGESSKPSDGLHARFPQYDYEDMVGAQYLLLTQGLEVDHLRLIMGTSMGCMHTWMWGERHPDFVDALMPLACLPVPVAGRNRVWRDLIIDAIRSDPQWQDGEYKTEPMGALRTAAGLLLIAGSAPIQMQIALPTTGAADEFVHKYLERELPQLDATDLLYQVNASRDYDPTADLGKIVAPVMWINSGDDFINPPELGIAERQIKRVKNGRFILLPASEQTHGHGTHSFAAVWQPYLGQLLADSQPTVTQESGRLPAHSHPRERPAPNPESP